MAKYRIPAIVSTYTNHDMIQAHTELPPLAEPRLRLLYAVLNDGETNQTHSELYTAVVSLVQVGMDTHDLIDTDTRRRTEKEMRSRQLKVLAGDYFSSRFYQLLALAGQTEMITRLSEAVCEVNRMKVNLYTRMRGMKLTADDYWGYAIQLKSELFSHFGDRLQGSLSRLWPDLLAGIARCEVALDELKRCDDTGRFERSWAYWYVLQAGNEQERHSMMDGDLDNELIEILMSKYEIRKQLGNKLKQALQGFKSTVLMLESDKLIRELTELADQLPHKLEGNMPALNETR
ncbi:heptaprenyl diphosphate synthase component 1 [Paenibacillus sp. strain BS8-2]